ncbi:MAG: NADH:ubiquinone reductase (Na(+)-transporting) subunit F [Myxococcales bacterium]|nr:NADH:ubiquinone reductase (Na(+)-transporting) subunit F [Myxococcales bacterium]
MIETALAIAFFSTLITSLVLLILLARRILLPEGVARVEVNERRTLDAQLGNKLLDALSAAGIALPSACGGKGTCGQCRIDVVGDAPPALPTDAARLDRRELAQGTRLACQLTLRGDLRIRIPDEIFGVRQWSCRVRSARCVGTMIREIVAELPGDERLDFRAGSFVQVTVPPYRARYRDFPIETEVRPEWDRLNLWRHEVASSAPVTRAYSLANAPEEDRQATLLVRLATPPPAAPEDVPPGIASSYLFSIEAGDSIDLAGPYGHFFASEGDAEMIFVGGGAGMAPLRSHILHQLGALRTQRRIGFWYGARHRRELLYADLFEGLAAEHPNFHWTPALSEPRPGDAWTGAVGFIHEVLESSYLAHHSQPENCEYYLCGPPLMARATCAMLARLGVPPENVHFDDFGA